MLSFFSRVKAPATKTHKRPTTRRATFERLEDRALLSGGAVLTVIPGTTSDWAQASFLDSSGKLVVGGFTNTNPQNFWALRYTNYQGNGTLALDPTFGNGGAVNTHVGSTSYANATYAAAAYGDKIVLGGRAGAGGDFALARYNANGSLDTTFGARGWVTTDLGGTDSVLGTIVQQDKIVVAGGGGSSASAAKLARYTSTGQLDASFGGGVVTPAFGGISSSFLAIAEDHGKILAAGGVTFVASTRAIALARYNSDGTPDSTFGNNGNGTVITDLPSHWAFARAIAVDPNPDTGYIYVAGNFSKNGVNSPGVLRYTSDGTLDTSFGGDGSGSVTFPNDGGAAYGAALQADGKLVAVGTSISGGVASSFVVRLNGDGTFDSTFGPDGNGIVENSFVSGINQPSSVVVQPDGRIVLSGGQGTVFVARYNPDGSLEDVAPSLSLGDVSKAEGNKGTTAFNFTVTLSSPIASPVTVQYATVDGTAGTQKPNVDYTATSGTLTIAAGKTTGTITVSVKGETTVEPDETFNVRIWNASPGTTIAKFWATGRILNDDGAAKIASPASAGPTGTALGATVLSAPAASPAQAPVVQQGISQSSSTAATLVFNGVAPTAGTTAPSTSRDTQGLPLPKRDYLAVDAAIGDLQADLLADELASVLVP